jgi:hypothetical protein
MTWPQGGNLIVIVDFDFMLLSSSVNPASNNISNHFPFELSDM